MHTFVKNDRVYNDQGQVAVLISPDFGAGWSTWEDKYKILYSPIIVNAILNGEHVPDKFPLIGPDFHSSCRTIVIEWIDVGLDFYIREYDGSEMILFKDSIKWETA